MGIAYEQAIAFFADKTVQRSEAPFVYLSSQTNGNRYPLFIVMEPTDEKPGMPAFSSYGLGSDCSVPLF